MTAGRLYCIQSWNNASETSGEQIGNRLAQSRGLHFDRLGNANVALYAEENFEKKPTKVPLKQRILPQSVRVDKLTAEIVELEAAYKAGEFSASEYSMLRAVAFKKRDRAVELYKKAIKVEEKAQSTVADDYTPIASNHYQIPVQNTGNDVKSSAGKACNSAKSDLVYFLGGALALLVLVKIFF